MAKTRSMNRNKNHDDDVDPSSSSMKRFKTCDSCVTAPWSKLNHDVLLLVMMQLGFTDFLSFSRVCKSWRSLALSNKNNFISSRPPMFIWVDHGPTNLNYCSLRDFERKRFEPIIPQSSRLTCYGLTCGYLIMFGNKHHDFWLVNPITGHQLHFPPSPFTLVHPSKVKAILVFSPSISKWVFIISYRFTTKISFCIEGKRNWNHVSSTLPFLDLHAFKGKIYTMHTDCCLCEMKLDPKNPKLILLETKNVPKIDLRRPEFVSSGENLLIMNRSNLFKDPNANKVLELDFDEMKWVSIEKTIGEYALFISNFNYSAAIKRESWVWADKGTQCKIYDYFRDESYLDPDKRRPDMFFYARMWYFPHDCLSVSLLDE